jgi:hypothetical protein
MSSVSAPVQAARLSKLKVDPLLSPVGCDTHKSQPRLPGRDGMSDLELPFPQIRFDLLQAEFNALAIHSPSSDSPRDQARQKRAGRLFKTDRS